MAVECRYLVESEYVPASNVRHLLTEGHFVRIRLETVELGRHGIGYIEGELLRLFPVLNEPLHVEN